MPNPTAPAPSSTGGSTSPAPSALAVGPSVPFSASATYGGQPAPQPTPTGTPDHMPGTPEPVARTMPRGGEMGIRGNPTAALIALLGLAVVLAALSR